MRVVILQPGYLPWLGFFDQMARCDLFVYHNDIEYDKQSWRNRNRIRTKEGWTWLTVPVKLKEHSSCKISEMRIDYSKKWQRRHWNLILENYRKAPFFKAYKDAFHEIYNRSWELLLDMNVFLVETLMKMIGIHRRIMFSSELNLGDVTKTDRLIKLLKKIGASTFLEGSAGRNYIEEHKFTDAGIELEYHDYVHPVYEQQFDPFIPYLSVMDLLFNCGDKSLSIITGGDLG